MLPFSKYYFFLIKLIFLFLFIPTHIQATVAKKSNHFEQAQSYLKQYQRNRKLSSSAMLESNQARKRLKQIRSQLRKTTNESEKKSLKVRAKELAQKIKDSQYQGQHLRNQNKDILQTTLSQFEEGMVEYWGEKITNRKPVAMGDSTTFFIAHNTQFRSVHPSMLALLQPGKEKPPSEGMSILGPALEDQNAPPDLDIRSFQLSRDHTFFAHIEVVSSDQQETPEINASLVPLNQIHRWHIILNDLNGQPISQANIELTGHMPGHVHGLPTAPRITREVEPGIYLLEGVKFQMKGWWVMQFDVSSNKINGENDSVVFNLLL
jgi:hypothetical protein